MRTLPSCSPSVTRCSHIKTIERRWRSSNSYLSLSFSHDAKRVPSALRPIKHHLSTYRQSVRFLCNIGVIIFSKKMKKKKLNYLHQLIAFRGRGTLQNPISHINRCSRWPADFFRLTNKKYTCDKRNERDALTRIGNVSARCRPQRFEQQSVTAPTDVAHAVHRVPESWAFSRAIGCVPLLFRRIVPWRTRSADQCECDREKTVWPDRLVLFMICERPRFFVRPNCFIFYFSYRQPYRNLHIG